MCNYGRVEKPSESRDMYVRAVGPSNKGFLARHVIKRHMVRGRGDVAWSEDGFR